MNTASARRGDILRKIGVEVWKLRAPSPAPNADETETAAETSAKMPDEIPTETPVETPGELIAPDPAASAAIASQTAAESSPAESSSTQSSATESLATENVDASVDASLAQLAATVAACQKCELHKSRTNTVFGCGNSRADWMFIGEAPGQNEDLQGEPFVGRAGKLLDKMIGALGMNRGQVFIANVVKCRPPDNRDPQPREVDNCEPYLHRQLALIRPKVIIALGRVSAQALLKTATPIGKLRGQIHRYGAADTPLIATYHPAYLLRSPGQKAAAWDDLWRAKMLIDET